MRIVPRLALSEPWQEHPPAEPPLLRWISQVAKAAWIGPNDIRAVFSVQVKALHARSA
jgi:mRNA-degrading endonuclease HigB of HigAB toxin-antitoxin module